MASIRNIKKDVDYLVGEVISDCYTYLFIHDEKNKEKVFEIIEGVVDKRNDLIQRINNPEKGIDKKQKKEYFKTIFNDLLKMVDDSFSKLSQLAN